LQNVLYTVTNHLVPALAAFLANSLSKSLAPLQRIPLSIPSGVVKIRFRRMSTRRLAISDGIEAPQIEECLPEEDKIDHIMGERCVEAAVLYQPEGEIAADVVFIHGLHGG